MQELKELIKKHKLTSDDLIVEAECVEEYGEYQYPYLMGYSAATLRTVAKEIEKEKQEMTI